MLDAVSAWMLSLSLSVGSRAQRTFRSQTKAKDYSERCDSFPTRPPSVTPYLIKASLVGPQPVALCPFLLLEERRRFALQSGSLLGIHYQLFVGRPINAVHGYTVSRYFLAQL